MDVKPIQVPVPPSNSFIYLLYFMLSANKFEGLFNELKDELSTINGKTYTHAYKEIIDILVKEASGSRSIEYDGLIESDLLEMMLGLSNTSTENNLSQFVLPLIAANAFKMTILIKPTCFGVPMMPIIPEHILLDEIMYVLYDTSESTFKLLVKKEKESQPTNSCSCGTRIQKKTASSDRKCINPFRCSCRKRNVPSMFCKMSM